MFVSSDFGSNISTPALQIFFEGDLWQGERLIRKAQRSRSRYKIGKLLRIGLVVGAAAEEGAAAVEGAAVVEGSAKK